MSAITTGVTIIGGRNDGSICGLNQDPPSPLVIPLNGTLTFAHNTGKRAYKVNVTNLDATDPKSGLPYTAYNMNMRIAPGTATNPDYPGFFVNQPEDSPGVYNRITVTNNEPGPGLGADLACCIIIYWEVDSKELSIVTGTGNGDPGNDVNDPRLTFAPN
ncbi:hypothetical protein DRH13_00190 [Candidatus Woesebacteria bacterium]|nr:MAG: hypothetical protein DRH13_00190 [Candidatus Woesebacteria bacterium]